MTEGTVLDMRVSSAPIASNDSASLWDFGSGVACFEVHTKMNALNVGVIELLEETIGFAGKAFHALVIGNDDPRAFSAGADLAYNYAMIERGDWPALARFFKDGQDLYQQLAALPVPVVAAVHGFALGGGCEMMLHSHAVVAHAGLRAGLPEIKVGLIPGWGGCTQLLLRLVERSGPDEGLALALAALQAGEIASSAAQAEATGLLRPGTRVVEDRAALLPAAVETARAMMAADPVAAALPQIPYCGRDAYNLHLERLESEVEAGALDKDSALVMREIIGVLTGYPEIVEPGTHPITVSLDKEVASASRLIRTDHARASIVKLVGGVK